MASAWVRVYGPDNDFDVNGNNRNLDNNNGAFGMTFCRGFSLLMLIMICMVHYALMIIFFSLTKKQESARRQNLMLLSLRRILKKICFFFAQSFFCIATAQSP